jgi:membrane protein DedA with SNARE-associated domain
MVEWITQLLERLGYVGIALLMLAENLFPPIPSELIMPFAGFTAAQGNLSIVGVLVAGTVGSLVGALPWYYAGRALGCKRLAAWADKHGRWLTMSGDEVKRANTWFARHCGKAVFFGRVVPAVRTLISVPAGIAEMSIARFLIYSTLGTLLWNVVLASLGFKLGENYSKVAEILDPITKGIIATIVVVYLYRVVRFKKSSASTASD